MTKILQLYAVLITDFLLNFASLILKKTVGFWSDDDALEWELYEEGWSVYGDWKLII